MTYSENKNELSQRITLNRNLRLLPINIIMAYLFVTIILYAVNINRPTTLNPWLLYPYLITSFMLLYFGFNRGSNIALEKCCRVSQTTLSHKEMFGFSRSHYNVILIISIALLHMTLKERTGSIWYNFSAFNDFGEAYLNNYNFVLGRERSILEWVRVFLSPITLLYLGVGVVCWKQLSLFQKLAMIYLAIGNVLLYLLSGMNKMFADTLVFLLIYILIGIYRYDTSKNKLNRFLSTKKKIYKLALFFIILAVIFLIIFSINISSRVGIEMITFESGFKYFSAYFSGGYVGLDYAFEQPFESTFGLGSSMYILQASRGWFGTDFFFDRTYLTKNELTFGYDQSVKWSSIFVWIGNDISLLGAMLIMYFIGKFFGKVWIEAIYSDNAYSVILCGLMMQLCFYIPANNQIVQTAEALGGLLFALFLRWSTNNLKITFRK